jgi:hypothetical protein
MRLCRRRSFCPQHPGLMRLCGRPSSGPDAPPPLTHCPCPRHSSTTNTAPLVPHGWCLVPFGSSPWLVVGATDTTPFLPRVRCPSQIPTSNSMYIQTTAFVLCHNTNAGLVLNPIQFQHLQTPVSTFERTLVFGVSRNANQTLVFDVSGNANQTRNTLQIPYTSTVFIYVLPGTCSCRI